MNIFEALRESHDRQRGYADALIKTSGDTPERAEAYKQLKAELQAHETAEERHFYIPLMAFDEEQALHKRGLARFVVKYQAALIFPLSLLQALSMHRSSIEFLVEKKAKNTWTESLMIVAHFVLYLGLLFTALEPLQAVLFIAVHRGLFGMYMVSIFAPNHKAMPVLDRDSQLDFLHRQVLTSRNVIAHPITDFWYGGLNYQIEHHLFPSMPRNKLREVQAIVKDFCRAHSIAYHETSVVRSYQEIQQHLHEVGAPQREARKAGCQ